jgi:hypothetical protein
MKRNGQILCSVAIGSLLVVDAAWCADFELLVDVDVQLYPGSLRMVEPVPGPGFGGVMFDGDRLAGTGDVGSVVAFVGNGTPMFSPNAFGSASFAFRRGSIPVPPNFAVPIMAIDYLGGPRLDLDGDLDDGVRSLVPVFDVDPVIIPGMGSYLELTADVDAGELRLERLDVTGNNEGGPGISAAIATTVHTLAGTQADGGAGDAINPEIDTRVGTLTAFSGLSGELTTVYRIDDLGYEIWQDSIDPQSGSASVLGTHQFLGAMRGWLVVRDSETDEFPILAGEGLGTTLWPVVSTEFEGSTVATAQGLVGGSATITGGPTQDDYTFCGETPASCNGGLELVDFGGDIGAYFDSVVVSRLGVNRRSFVYLEGAGFGVNNSFDPVFSDTIGWDVVFVASSECGLSAGALIGDLNDDSMVDLSDVALLQDCVDGPDVGNCDVADLNGDGAVDLLDWGRLQVLFGDSVVQPPCTLGGSGS